MKKTHRFTLVELLLVTITVAVMAGVLVPSLNAAAKEAAARSCTANLKQIMTAAAKYQTDNQGCFCPVQSYTMINGKQKFTGKLWPKMMADYLGEAKLKTGFREKDGVLACPDFGERKPFKGYAPKTMFEVGHPDYGMNSYGPGQTRGLGTQIEKISQVRKPAELIYFGDSFSKDFGGLNGTYAILAYAYVGFRHENKANFGFADGHVGAKTAEEVHYKGKDASKRLPWAQLWK